MCLYVLAAAAAAVAAAAYTDLAVAYEFVLAGTAVAVDAGVAWGPAGEILVFN